MINYNIGGYDFKVVEQGAGYPVIFVHGSVSDYRTWEIPQSEIAKKFHTIAYSRKYHWPNQVISEVADYSMTDHVNDLIELIKLLNLGAVHLAGHSYGAFISLLLALKTPEMVRSLVLEEPPAFTLFVSDPPKPHELLKLLLHNPGAASAIIKFGMFGIVPATSTIKRGDKQKTMKIFGKATLGKKAFNHLSEARREQVQQNMIKAEFLGSGYPRIDIDILRRLMIPTLLLSAQNSPSFFNHIIHKLTNELPYVEHKEIRNASHIMHEDNPKDFNAAVIPFLKKYSK